LFRHGLEAQKSLAAKYIVISYYAFLWFFRFKILLKNISYVAMTQRQAMAATAHAGYNLS